MDEQPTCGKGLAANASLPAKLGELTAAVAGVLETHMKALDPTDENSAREHEAYAVLAKEHRETAARLQATAERMAGYRDLPMGRHDMRAMAGPNPRAAFATFVRLEQELLAQLQQRLTRDREMLAQMGAHS
jgi:hypothetical protein